MGIALLLSCALHVGLCFAIFPPGRRGQTVEEALRFGYPGPTRYEREIQVRLSDPSRESALRMIGGLRRIPDVSREGTPVPQAARSRTRRGRKSATGSEILSQDPALAGLRRRHLDLPTVQSEDLVILTLVRPEYPREAVQKELEGRVELLALVNEHGVVEDVEIIQSGGALFDAAATNAVLRCRFAPYRLHGKVQRVYADFKFRFTLIQS